MLCCYSLAVSANDWYVGVELTLPVHLLLQRCILTCHRCGSGTFAIEAALLAMRRAPGLQAMGYFAQQNGYSDDSYTNGGYTAQPPPPNEGGWSPAVQRWPDFDYPLWKRECAAAAALALPAPPMEIAVSDWHAGALGLAHSDAQRAGVVQHIQVYQLVTSNLHIDHNVDYVVVIS
jgi:23S rRNA G2445 N2-methylase RlmL